ncbi:MAG: radical SAM/SPASM domain-containing protein [Candidatus Omnitrophota bacterium]
MKKNKPLIVCLRYIRDFWRLRYYLKPDTIRYCHHLWEETFINYLGDVYACCHYMPEIVGNIYRDSWAEIWNSRRMKISRKRCLAGALHCRRACYIASRQYDLPQRPPLSVAPDKLRKIWLLFGERCNVSCIMCPQRGQDTSIPVLDFEKIKDKIPVTAATTVVIQGGEPLFMPGAIEAFRFYGEKGCDVSFITNGTIMNERLARMIVQYSKSYNVSLNAATKETHEKINRGSCFEKVLANIVMIKRIAKALNKDCKVLFHMTIVPENLHEIALFIRKAKEIGADIIEFGYDASAKRLLKKNPPLRARVAKDAYDALKDMDGQYDKTYVHELKFILNC